LQCGQLGIEGSGEEKGEEEGGKGGEERGGEGVAEGLESDEPVDTNTACYVAYRLLVLSEGGTTDVRMLG
jgi:hypothetical protein